MIVALIWLTISTPFVFHFQQELINIEKTQAKKNPSTEKGNNKPKENTNKENIPSINTSQRRKQPSHK